MVSTLSAGNSPHLPNRSRQITPFGSDRSTRAPPTAPSNLSRQVYYGPNFLPQVIEQEDEQEPAIQVKQTIKTEYRIRNNGVIYSGEVNETNVWGTHPHQNIEHTSSQSQPSRQNSHSSNSGRNSQN
jgi:hypothetical protein